MMIKSSLLQEHPFSDSVDLVPKVSIAPEVDITDLELEKQNKELMKFETTN